MTIKLIWGSDYGKTMNSEIRFPNVRSKVSGPLANSGGRHYFAYLGNLEVFCLRWSESKLNEVYTKY